MLLKTKTDKVIILGINDLSINLARRMSKNKDVVLLDNEIDDSLSNIDGIQSTIKYDLYSSLCDYNINDTSLFIAMTNSDEYNMFATRLAAELGAKNTIAMVYSMNYLNMTADDYVFNPYQLILNRINSFVKETRLKNFKNIIPGKVNVTEFTIKNNDTLSYKKIKDFKIDDSIIIAIKRDKKITIPSGKEKLYPGDIVYLLYKEGIIRYILNKIWKKSKLKKSVFIVGGNKLGYRQALNWQDIYNIIIVEPDLKICNQLAEKVDNYLILHGEGVDSTLLKEEGMNNSSIVLTLDSNDFHNLLSSYTATNIGCKKVITLLNHTGYRNIARMLGLENIIILPELITKHILLYIESGKKINKYILGEEIFTTRIKINKNKNIINKNICTLNLPKNLIIGVIIRDKRIIIPSGNNKLKINDEIIVFYDRKIETNIHNFFC